MPRARCRARRYWHWGLRRCCTSPCRRSRLACSALAGAGHGGSARQRGTALRRRYGRSHYCSRAQRFRCWAGPPAPCSRHRARCSRWRATAHCRAWLAAVHPRHHTPYVAILAYGTLVLRGLGQRHVRAAGSAGEHVRAGRVRAGRAGGARTASQGRAHGARAASSAGRTAGARDHLRVDRLDRAADSDAQGRNRVRRRVGAVAGHPRLAQARAARQSDGAPRKRASAPSFSAPPPPASGALPARPSCA